MKKSIVILSILLGLTGMAAPSPGWSSMSENPPAGVKQVPPAETKPTPPFYFGITEKPVFSQSVVDSPRSSYEFAPVLQFDMVKHDFIIKNTSEKMLELKKATGCCGSLVEAFSRQIPPGREGVIKVVLLTDRRGGQEIRGTIRAETNDPANPEWTINISCYVKKFADISADTIMLNGSWRKPVEGSSVVMPVAEYPFRIVSLKVKRGIFITYGYKEISKNGRKGYLIWARNTRKGPGVIRDSIYVETDNPARRQFLIRVQGKLVD